MRTFIAIDVSPGTKEKAGRVIEELKGSAGNVKWVEKENLHVTLKFLGEISEEASRRVIRTAEKALAGKRSFPLSFSGIGTFPGGKYPRVVWIGAKEGTDEAKDLASAIDEALLGLGFEKEKRPFRAHLTIGRAREGERSGAISGAIERFKEEDFGRTSVGSVNIMKSTLTRKGPIYEVIKSIKLKKEE